MQLSAVECVQGQIQLAQLYVRTRTDHVRAVTGDLTGQCFYIFDVPYMCIHAGGETMAERILSRSPPAHAGARATAPSRVLAIRSDLRFGGHC
jgi:hypothetical protein